MISNPGGTTVLSSLGWIDHDALWRFDSGGGAPETIPLHTGGRYSSLHHLGSERFAVAHHFDGRRFEVSVRSFSDPGGVLAHAAIADDENSVSGDSSAWSGVPLLYIGYLGFAPWKDFALLRISPSTHTIEIQRLQWYDDSYDKLYQGVGDVLALPDTECALVSVQRSSRLILHDLETGAQRRSIDLGGRGGNPTLVLRNSGNEVWASDYDTLVVLRTDDWRVVKRSRLQRASAGMRQFIGEFSFAPDQALCVVARPFNADVVAIDLASLRIRSSAKVGRQPLEAVALAGGEIVARDWKTGDLLRGALERRWLAR
jgi:hypothetical protein